ncbi:MAG: hypothetical protein MUC85_00910 [Anaerolineales bacterium]|jgi:photosystem II stability/assembly factor-like uncharacterized protein|nr:hypothetical protein [Anaerolineales bacterium]
MNRYNWILLPILCVLLSACQPKAPTATTQPVDIATEPASGQITPSIPLTVTPAVVPPTSEISANPRPTLVEIFMPLVPLSPGQNLQLAAIQMFPGGVGWALGGTSSLPTRVLLTQDNARTWLDRTPPEPAPSPGAVEKSAVAFFYTSQMAWVTFAPPDPADEAHQPVVWRTTDSGLSWQASQVLQDARVDTVYSPSLIYFTDPVHGWLMAHHGAAAGHTPVSIHRTTDGGATWQVVARPMDELSYPLHTCCQSGMIFFEDALTGLVARDGGPIPMPHILRTTDGGATWEQLDMVEPQAGFYEKNYCTTSSLQRITGQTASVVMNCNGLDPNGPHSAFAYLIGDEGQTGSVLPLPEPNWPKSWVNVRSKAELQWLDADIGWLIVTAYYELSSSSEGHNATRLYQTLDGGYSWDAKGLTYWMGTFSFPTAARGYAVARAGTEVALVYSEDNGLNWGILEPFIGK